MTETHTTKTVSCCYSDQREEWKVSYLLAFGAHMCYALHLAVPVRENLGTAMANCQLSTPDKVWINTNKANVSTYSGVSLQSMLQHAEALIQPSRCPF